MDVLDRPLTRRGVGSLASGLLVTGLAALSGCAVGDSSAPTAAPERRTTTGSAAPAAVAERAGALVPEPPVGIQLVDGRRVAVRTVGTTANGVLDVPSDIDVAGWWSGGSQLGDPFGSTLIAAHVDSTTQGLGPFASLLSVERGAHVFVWSDGLRQTFEIKSRWLRPRGTLGARSWLHSPEGARRLVLVTCAGPFDRARGGYQNLAVIVAEPRGKAVQRT